MKVLYYCIVVVVVYDLGHMIKQANSTYNQAVEKRTGERGRDMNQGVLFY